MNWIQLCNDMVEWGELVTYGNGPSVSVKGGKFLENLRILIP